ncbi:MAG TPA: hypothetical protein PKY10_05325 [Lentisphaeria bacterium]|nr:hypothetical protein [Lentisphaeria bacterium]
MRKNMLFKAVAPLFLMIAVLGHSDDDLKRLGDLLRPYAARDYWQTQPAPPPLTRTALVRSIEAARAYYLNQQKSDGSFIYGKDMASDEVYEDDNQVRQAGALWGLASLNRDRSNEPTRRGVILGLDFFARCMTVLPTGESTVVYPDEENIKTGTVALYCLSLIEFLRSEGASLPKEVKDRYQTYLDLNITYLQSMEMPDGSWARSYDAPSGFRETIASPYYDGEALLAYCKAARYLGRTDLLPRIEYAMPRLIAKYTVVCWRPGGDTKLTKGFYQWGCMASAEYLEAGWTTHAELATDAALAMSWWLLYDNQLEYRQGNTAYAVEGLVGAWRAAKVRKDTKSMAVLQETAERITNQLITLQYGGPYQDFNPLLKSLRRVKPESFGGISASRDSAVVRIDVQQHQTHAMLMILNCFFTETPAGSK